MANPSTDGPTSALGTEILRRAYKETNTSSGGTELLDGTAGYIYTILSVIFNERSGTAGAVDMWIEGDGSANIGIVKSQAIPANGTFVFSDRFILAGADNLVVGQATTNDVDIWVSYIEQRWV